VAARGNLASRLQISNVFAEVPARSRGGHTSIA